MPLEQVCDVEPLANQLTDAGRHQCSAEWEQVACELLAGHGVFPGQAITDLAIAGGIVFGKLCVAIQRKCREFGLAVLGSFGLKGQYTTVLINECEVIRKSLDRACNNRAVLVWWLLDRCGDL